MGGPTSRAAALVAGCVGGALLAGCGVRSEPIAQPQVSASVCLPAPSGPVTQGTTALRNSGGEPARITRVALRGARGISVVDVRVFVLTAPPGDGATLVGALDEFPPDTGPTVGLQEPLEWNAGSGVPGPELPADPDAVANVVLGVTRSAPGAGTAEGIDVTSTSGGREYTWRGQASLTLTPTRCG